MSGKGVLAKRQSSKAPVAASSGLGSLFKIYTDDTPGIKIGPTTVLVLSLIYMAIVVSLHILAKVKAITFGTNKAGQEL